MTKTTKIALFSVPIIIGAYLIYRQFSKPKAKSTTVPEKKTTIADVQTQIQNPPPPKKGCSYPLKKGLYNCDLVKQLQRALNSYPNYFVNYPLVEDGDFGAKTEAALSDVTYQLYNYQDANSGNKDVWDLAAFNKIVTDIQKKIQEVEIEIAQGSGGVPLYPYEPTPQPQPPFWQPSF